MKNLLISFSGGETSAFMTQYLWHNEKEEYNMKIVFANTGQENEETLIFVQKFSEYFNIPIIWVEAKVYHHVRKGSGYNIVDFTTASRDGKPFEEVIKKYTIPSMAYPHCTRELKSNPIKAIAKDLFNNQSYYLAIGIRNDEIDRMNKDRNKLRIIYPLIHFLPTSKPMINFFWRQMPFRLNLKSYEGNCKTCWKKSDKKLFHIAKESPESFDFTQRIDDLYSKNKVEGCKPYLFYRG